MKTIKNQVLTLLLAVIVAAGMSSCSKVPAGNVGIEFHLLGSDKGVDYEVLTPGRYYIGYNEELFLFPTFNQTKTWTSDKREESPVDEDFNFQSREGLKMSASVGLEYHVPAENVPQIFQKYKAGLEEVSNKVLRNAIRDAFTTASSTRTAEEMYGSGKIAFMQAVTDIAQREATERGIVIDDIYLIGNMGIPESVTTALNAKIQATQKAQQRENELRQTVAEAEKVKAAAEGEASKIITVANAQAEANRIINASLTKNLIEYEKAQRWNGTLPQVTGGAGVFLNMDK